MEDKQIVEAIEESIYQLKKEERPLIPGTHERSFAHRLAVHMEPLFEGWNIDCEYNRFGMLKKELDGIKQCDEQRTTDRIYPDIIVHLRTNEEKHEKGENLLVIELKNDSVRDKCDITKLKLMTCQSEKYKYQLGLYINIGDYKFDRIWYKDGKEISEQDLCARDGSNT